MTKIYRVLGFRSLSRFKRNWLSWIWNLNKNGENIIQTLLNLKLKSKNCSSRISRPRNSLINWSWPSNSFWRNSLRWRDRTWISVTMFPKTSKICQLNWQRISVGLVSKCRNSMNGSLWSISLIKSTKITCWIKRGRSRIWNSTRLNSLRSNRQLRPNSTNWICWLRTCRSNWYHLKSTLARSKNSKIT